MPSLKIRRIDTSNPHAARQLAALQNPFADQAHVVSGANKKLSQQAFGEALPPVKAVEKICTDVRNKGMSALLHYTEAFDKVRLTRSSGVICVELMKKVQDHGFRIAEVPVHHYHRTYGKSQFFNFPRVGRTLVDLMRLWLELVARKDHLSRPEASAAAPSAPTPRRQGRD